jgi:hypothetical protein
LNQLKRHYHRKYNFRWCIGLFSIEFALLIVCFPHLHAATAMMRVAFTPQLVQHGIQAGVATFTDLRDRVRG